MSKKLLRTALAAAVLAVGAGAAGWSGTALAQSTWVNTPEDIRRYGGVVRGTPEEFASDPRNAHLVKPSVKNFAGKPRVSEPDRILRSRTQERQPQG